MNYYHYFCFVDFKNDWVYVVFTVDKFIVKTFKINWFYLATFLKNLFYFRDSITVWCMHDSIVFKNIQILGKHFLQISIKYCCQTHQYFYSKIYKYSWITFWDLFFVKHLITFWITPSQSPIDDKVFLVFTKFTANNKKISISQNKFWITIAPFQTEC